MAKNKDKKSAGNKKGGSDMQNQSGPNQTQSQKGAGPKGGSADYNG